MHGKNMEYHQIKYDIEIEMVMHGVICHNQFWA